MEKFRKITSRYLVMGLHNEGYNGKVAKCFNVDKAKMVLIKIQKDTENDLFQQELAMLEAVRVLDSDNKNIVRFIEHFRFQELHCLVFEMLDRSLLDLLLQRECMPLSLSEIRLLTHQLLVSLEALKSIGIIHTDIKLDNIMLVNHKDQPFKIKLINFGLALPVSQVKVGMYMQNRTPEVTLGLPLSEYFIFDQDTGWRLRTPEEYEDATGHKDRMAFFDLLICCLHLDAERRISPSEALKQSFLTMVHMRMFL
uniref:Protein kinase domain-containing protein n=1 Tax=Scophthalmus maximus TaxID=52904 RepID=A0A8D3A663_SCOMX